MPEPGLKIGMRFRREGLADSGFRTGSATVSRLHEACRLAAFVAAGSSGPEKQNAGERSRIDRAGQFSNFGC
jgi:hypothetical protein